MRLDRMSQSATGHRPAAGVAEAFFLGGIIVGLTLGASWGTHLLERIGSSSSFTAVSVHEVNAHGHAQVFGWVGLFVMGFAYRFFPTWKGVRLPSVRLAYASLVFMFLGIGARSILGPPAQESITARYLAIGGSFVELAAIGIFVGSILVVVRRSSEQFRFYDYYIAAALGWFVVQAVWDAVYFAALSSVESREQLLRLIAGWQAPLREIQVHGFAMLMVFGVSQRMLPGFYGLRPSRPRRSVAALAVLNLALLGMVAGFVMMSLAGHRWAALWYSATLLLALGVVAVVTDLGILGTPKYRDRSLKFFRHAYAWLLVSIAMLVFLPGHQLGLLGWLAPESQASQIGFSHAYYGAIRHAVTVGFISQMILGMASKVVPAIRGVDESALSSLWMPFALLNTGCALRVSMQVLSDFRADILPWIAMSGMLEVVALALWGGHVARMIFRRNRQAVASRDNPAFCDQVLMRAPSQ